MGLQARLMSQALRKLTGIVSKSKTCLIFINQIREKIGVMFGNPETTTGGRALKFYARFASTFAAFSPLRKAIA
jgi:recombination protein RecA